MYAGFTCLTTYHINTAYPEFVHRPGRLGSADQFSKGKSCPPYSLLVATPQIGARVAALADTDEVLVSSTVKDLVAGSGLRFGDRGIQSLKGVPGEWHIYAVAISGPHRA